MINSRIENLRKKLKRYNIDGYIVPKNDEYFNEYSSPDRLKFISNFDGSAGLAIILKDKNYLFVDGRYTTQAKYQSGKNYNVVPIHQKLPWTVIKNKIQIGYNPYCFTSSTLLKYFKTYIRLKPIYNDLIKVQSNKKNKKFYLLNKNITGEDHKQKIARVLKYVREDKSDCYFVSAPENVAWLLNLRGSDNPHSPIPNCRLILKTNGEIIIFTKKSKIYSLLKNGFFIKTKLKSEGKINKFLENLKAKKIIIDRQSCSVAYEKIIKKKTTISDKTDPIYYMKSIKNSTEIKNIIKSHIFDGVAVIKFLCWFKNNKHKLTELDAQKKLEYFRKKHKYYLYPSFNTIAASGPNSAIIHYKATKKTNRLIKKKEIFLLDSGGQYKYGTTDITRTLCLKKQTQKIKDIFTRVLKGHIAVVTANLKKIKSANLLDMRARKYLIKKKLDYPHGTGHGVGYFLNVHEGPIAISKGYKILLETGQVISNEPGFYKKNKFGIRIENMIYVSECKHRKLFKNLTMVPIEKSMIDYNILSKKEKNYLIDYNLEIYTKLERYLEYNEKFWLLSQF